MQPLTLNNIESELSYAYLHAVATRAGVGCKPGNRHDDNAGIDAELTAWGPFSGGGYLHEIDINIQLKATTKTPTDNGSCLSYSLEGIARYDDLRSTVLSTPRILVVLFLPSDAETWLTLDNESLTLRKCAYWVSLYGAPESQNQTSQTVYLPKEQRFDPEGLLKICSHLSLGKKLHHGETL